MAILTPGVVPASELREMPRSGWLDEFARFAAHVTFEDLPEAVVARTKLVILDCLGAITAGQAEPECRALATALERLEGRGASPVIGSGTRLSPATAAYLAGTAGTMLELDEGNQFARGHPGIHVVPAALVAAARLGATGRDLILAVALGYEIGARIGIASKLVVTSHPHGTWGTVGAALAVARLHEPDATTIANVINLASSMGLATSRRTMLEGATVRNTYAGAANRAGLIAWELAGAGFRGEADGVATVFGSVAASEFRPEEMTRDLGTRWEIARNYFKRHAACRYTHAALDALDEIRHQAGARIDPRTILAGEIETYVWAAQLDDPEPPTMLAAKFSLPFAVATSLVRGAADVEAFRDAARGDRVTRALASRIAVNEDSALTALLPDQRAARVTLRLADGRVLSALATTNKGDTEDPYSADEVRAKFLSLAAPVLGRGRAEEIVRLIGALDSTSEPGALLASASLPEET